MKDYNESYLGIKIVDENAQVYFDLEEKIPAEDIERYKRALSEEEALADSLHKLHLKEVEQRYEEWLEQPHTGDTF